MKRNRRHLLLGIEYNYPHVLNGYAIEDYLSDNTELTDAEWDQFYFPQFSKDGLDRCELLGFTLENFSNG